MIRAIVLMSIIFAVSIAANAQVATSVDGFGWMAGCWEVNSRGGAMLISEQWMKPAGGSLIGMSRTVRNGKTAAFEFVRIVATADGISYIAKPSTNKDETAFKLLKSSATELVFENLAHDFPQRIIYRADKPDSLFARIEGTQNGKLEGMNIPMKRVKCE